jgi:putative tryptophan/tyrosine transport system substrate-binding protein
VLPDAMLWNERRVILTWAAAARAPGVFPEREYADDGGLIGYGPNVPANFHRAAAYVDRILKGKKAGDLPIEQPAKLDFVDNLKFTAVRQGRWSSLASSSTSDKR